MSARRLTTMLPAMILADIHDFPSPAPVYSFAHRRAELHMRRSSGMANDYPL
jgi:hypothetical protein